VSLSEYCGTKLTKQLFLAMIDHIKMADNNALFT